MSGHARPVTYADGVTPVMLADRVSVRLFLRRRTGEVIYVPGISQRRGTYEHSGLTWVGISLPQGWAVGSIVLPETGRLQKSVRFLGRGTESPDASEANSRLDVQEQDEDAREQADAAAAAVPAGKPTMMDWLAMAAAVGLQLGIILLIVTVFIGVIVLLRRLL